MDRETKIGMCKDCRFAHILAKWNGEEESIVYVRCGVEERLPMFVVAVVECNRYEKPRIKKGQ